MHATTVTVSTLTDTIRRALSRFPRERGRIERAATLVALGHIEQVSPDAFAVRSQTDDGVSYVVTIHGDSLLAASCSCVDAARHPGQQCKHQWACSILLVAEERQRRLDAERQRVLAEAVAAADRVALQYAKSIGWAA